MKRFAHAFLTAAFGLALLMQFHPKPSAALTPEEHKKLQKDIVKDLTKTPVGKSKPSGGGSSGSSSGGESSSGSSSSGGSSEGSEPEPSESSAPAK